MSDKHDLLNDNDMCSFSGHEVEDMCFNSGDDACRDYSVAHSHQLLEILEFQHFFEHFTFDKTEWSDRGKVPKKYITVTVVLDIDTVGLFGTRIVDK